MKRHRFIAAGLVVLAALLFTNTAQAGWWDDMDSAKPVELSEVVRHPHAYKGKEIVFECVFHKVTTFYNPYYTRFVPSQYVNFSVWTPEAKLWDKDDYVDSVPFLFIERDHDDRDELVATKRFTRLKCSGWVQNAFKNMPWIEIRHFEVVDDSLTKDALKEIILGDRAMSKGKLALATAHLGNAADMDLPDDVMAEVEKKRGQVWHQQGYLKLAAKSYERALDLKPGDKEAEKLLAQLIKNPDRPPSATVEVTPVDPKRYETEPEALPVPEEPMTEEPAVEEPAVEEPVVEEPAIEEPAVEEPAVEEPAIEEPVVEEPAVEEPVVEEPAVEEPAVEEPA
ncbi:MAG: tetratricopeptide repeat protein, partial [Planctomycetota bacterium]